MDLIADGLLIAGALSAAVYCWILSVRIKRLSDLDDGLGAAIAGLSAKVDQMQTILANTKESTGASKQELEALVSKASRSVRNLERLLDEADETAKAGFTKFEPQPQARTADPEPVAKVIDPDPVSVPEAPTEPTQSEDETIETEEEPAALTAAMKLQQQIRARLSSEDREAPETRQGQAESDIVKTLQNILASNK